VTDSKDILGNPRLFAPCPSGGLGENESEGWQRLRPLPTSTTSQPDIPHPPVPVRLANTFGLQLAAGAFFFAHIGCGDFGRPGLHFPGQPSTAGADCFPSSSPWARCG
jgi:hypothetical protein